MNLNSLTGSQNSYSKITDSIGINPEGLSVKEQIEKLKKLNSHAENQFEGKFPVHVFPEPVQNIIFATNKDLNFPTDFVAAGVIFTTSVATGNTYQVRHSSGRQTSALINIASVGRPGTNKTQPQEFALWPIVERENKLFQEYKLRLSEYKLSMTSWSGEGDPPIEPFFCKTIVSDFTPEALAHVHGFNLRGLGAYRDELAGLVKDFNRYRPGSDQEFWTSLWSGLPINIDRKKDGPVYIPKPFISMAGTIQPGILKDLAGNGRSQSGFMDRILFAYPADCEKTVWSETELDASIPDLWKMIVDKILKIELRCDEHGQPLPNVIGFTPKAKKLISEFQRKNTDEVNQNQDERMASILSKFDIHVLRLALILEILHYGCGNSDLSAISEQSAEGAIHLAHYFKSTAARVNEVINPSDPLSKFSNQMKTLFNELPLTFTTELGLSIAIELGVNERTYYRFLEDRKLFDKLKRGSYEKRNF